MKDAKVTKVTITKDGKYIYSGDEPMIMEIETFRSKFKRIKKCAYSLFDNTNDAVQFIYDYLNNDFKKTYIYQVLSQAEKVEYEYLCSDIQHVWENLNIR